MILVIDIGNTNIVLGLYRGGQLEHHWRLATNRNATTDEYGIMVCNLLDYAEVARSEIEGVMISTVVPPLRSTFEQLCIKYLNQVPMVVGPGMRTGLNIRYENPKEVGADRIVNAVAGIELYGTPLIIVDFGTATTFDYIDEQGQYIGGAIAPGIGISTEALYEHAAKLPRIELVHPGSVIGKNTVESMQAGIIHGFASQVDGLVQRIEEEQKTRTRVIATGGLAELISEQARRIDVVAPHLTLQGLRILYERNRVRQT